MTDTRLVDFIVAGAQKSGTTALDLYLRKHPELCLPWAKKEVHFFDRDRYFVAEPLNYAAYHAFFRPQRRHRLLGEGTPDYLYWPSAAERMARYNPGLKLILLLRNPVTRAFSQWNMARQKRRDTLSFFDALKAEAERTRTMPPELAKRLAYVGRGLYAQQLKRLWYFFPREQTIAFKSEELLASPATVLATIADFLGIAQFAPVAPTIVHAYRYERAMSDDERSHLIAIFEPEIRELEHLLDWDCSAWLT